MITELEYEFGLFVSKPCYSFKLLLAPLEVQADIYVSMDRGPLTIFPKSSTFKKLIILFLPLWDRWRVAIFHPAEKQEHFWTCDSSLKFKQNLNKSNEDVVELRSSTKSRTECFCVCVNIKIPEKEIFLKIKTKKVFCRVLYMTKLPVWEKQKNSEVGSCTFY